MDGTVIPRLKGREQGACLDTVKDCLAELRQCFKVYVGKLYACAASLQLLLPRALSRLVKTCTPLSRACTVLCFHRRRSRCNPARTLGSGAGGGLGLGPCALARPPLTQLQVLSGRVQAPPKQLLTRGTAGRVPLGVPRVQDPR